MHNSAIRFMPGGIRDNAEFTAGLLVLMQLCRELADKENKEVQLYFQHNLRRDVLVLVVEAGPLTFSGSDPNPVESLVQILEAMEMHLYGEIRRAKKKQTPREQGC
jgi:hypothetical protein